MHSSGMQNNSAAYAGLIAPEILEARRRELRIAHGMLNVLVPEIGLQRARIDAVVRQLVAARMPQHVRVNREVEAGCDAQTRHHLGKPAVVNGAPRSDVNTNGKADSCSRLSLRNARSSRPESG